MSERALVTGAGGFVGANLVRRLLADGVTVVATARPGPRPWRLADVEADVEVLQVDLRDAAAVEAAAIAARPARVYHLAAHGAYSWQRDLRAMVDVNILATRALLDAARALGGAALVMTGSSSEYGLKDHAPREDEALDPNSEYAVTKAAGTHLCRLAAVRDGIPAVVLRLYSVYGPWEEPGRLVPALVRRGLDGELPPLVAPETARDYVYVDDACEAIFSAGRAAESLRGEVLNVGSGRQTTLRELVDVARAALGVDATPVWGTMAQRAWDATTWVADPSAAERRMGWRATTTLPDGLTRTAAWMAADQRLRDRYTA